jgi:uncharacterized membrane protein
LFGVIAARRRLITGVIAGLLAWIFHPFDVRGVAHVALAWDIGVLLYLLLLAQLFLAERGSTMEEDSEAQETGQWTVFGLTLIGSLLSLAAILSTFSGLPGLKPEVRDARVALVCVTLLLSWLMTNVTFALRYAHEYYDRDENGAVEGGLEFPGTSRPDYLDFVYFSFVLGMTFQVSDVQISAQSLRRLATLHGMVGFLFNTVILALVVNLAAGLL